LCPTLFGNTFTVDEHEFWIAFNTLQQAEMHDVDPNIWNFFDVVEEIKYKIQERKKELYNSSRQASSNRKVIYSGRD
jgi:hypothetical protein